MKSFSWSYSKFKNYDVCPKRHYEVDLAKNFNESSEQLTWGNDVHHAFSAAILHRLGLPAVGTGRDRIDPAPLPDNMKDYKKWIDIVCAVQPGERVLVERKYAITRDFQPCDWFAGNAWFRGICDALSINGTFGSALDWKTGKLLHDSRQLMLMAQCIFVHHPELQRIKTRFVWLKDDCTTPEEFRRDAIMREWPPVLEQVKRMEEAARTLTYEPRPNKFCFRHCPVVSCPEHGKRH